MWSTSQTLFIVIVIALTMVGTAHQAARAQSELRRPVESPGTTAAAPQEGWSTDDVKDVFEATKHLMISIGIGVALYWFWAFEFPARKLARIEFDADVIRVGENNVASIIEVVATVSNLGRARVELTELCFALKSVQTELVTEQSGSLAGMNVLSPLFEGQWTPNRLVLDPGTKTRLTFAAAIPKTVFQVFVNAQAKSVSRPAIYEASRLIQLIGTGNTFNTV
jgi:hypothetical protein